MDSEQTSEISIKLTNASAFNDVTNESINECIKIAKYNALNSELYCNCNYSNCSNCNKTNTKCISNGSLNASIMMVDAFPSEYESALGAFTEEKGFLLNEVLKGTKYKRADIYCTNIVKCSNVQDTNPGIITHCLEEYFYKEVELIKPKCIILTYSAFQACLKYKVIPYVGNVSYFNKIRTNIRNLEMDMFIVYDIKTLTQQQRDTFKQGMKIILQ
jgi:uracil-DNA glycosylase family 4